MEENQIHGDILTQCIVGTSRWAILQRNEHVGPQVNAGARLARMVWRDLQRLGWGEIIQEVCVI